MSRDITEQMAAELDQDREGLAQTSTADRVAALLRTHIMEGLFPPGTRLSEEAIGQALGISRNTLREAFRLLCHERVAVHEFNRGIFVPILSSEDVVDIYALRRLVEGGAVRMAPIADTSSRMAVVAAAERCSAAAVAGRWLDFRTADLQFHLAVSALAKSHRVDELMRRTLAELRLVFHVMPDAEDFHSPFASRNSALAELIEAKDGEAAYRELLQYLADGERQILAAYAGQKSTATEAPSEVLTPSV